MKFKYSNTLFFVVRLALPLLVICSIYFPEYYTFSIDRMGPSSEIVNNLETVPATDVLNEVAAITMGTSPAISVSQRNSMANALLEGKLVTPRLQPASVPLVGWPDDLLHGDPSFQLMLASLEFENLLLEAFEYSGDRRYYQAARSRILAFADWEEQQRKPIAFLWNDHAIAARIAVIVRFWRHLRLDADATDLQKASLVGLVMRSGELLAKQNLFTVRTNHGVMQNIALLQLTAAFPLLPKTKDWRNLAFERLELQLGFYVSDEGVVLEHSAGYHLLGTELLAEAATLIRLNGMAPSKRLLKAIQNTEKFSRMLLRPDGTLPAFGNTDAGSHESLTIIRNNGMGKLQKLVAPFSPPPEMTVLFAVSGYALWWSQFPVSAQTVVVWSNHRLHGHKHADEPSIHMWSRGYNWITATGYWPYGHEGFDEANGWAGSNAPHALKESASSPRQTRLLGIGNDGPLRVADIEVCRHSRMCVRRQVLQLSAELLLVVDNISNSDAETEILWTTDPRLRLRQINKQSFESNETEMGHRLHIELTSATNQEIALLSGSVTPFAGWVVSSGTPQPSYAIRAVHQGREVAMATLIEVTESPKILSFQSFTRKDNEDWRISLRRQGDEVSVERKGRNLSVIQPNDTVSIRINEPPNIAKQQIALRSAMDEAIDHYPPRRDLSEYYSRLYMIIVLLWLVTEVGIIANTARIRKQPWLQFAPMGGWVVFALWIHFWYLI